MKPKLFTAILLFISAYSPLFIILAVKDFDFSSTHAFNHPITVAIMLLLTLASITLLFRLNEISRGCTRCRGVVILGTELWKADGVSLLVDC